MEFLKINLEFNEVQQFKVYDLNIIEFLIVNSDIVHFKLLSFIELLIDLQKFHSTSLRFITEDFGSSMYVALHLTPIQIRCDAKIFKEPV